MVVWVKEKPLLLPLKLWSTDYLFYMLKQKEDKINSTCSTKNEKTKSQNKKNKKDPVWSKPVIVNYVWKSKKKKYDLHNFYRILKKVIVSSLKKHVHALPTTNQNLDTIMYYEEENLEATRYVAVFKLLLCGIRN